MSNNPSHACREPNTVSVKASAVERRPLVLIGSPRSGTSWIGKLFDSHPDVLYRHEPDRIDRGSGIPQILDGAGSAAHLDAGRAWLDRLVRLRAFEANTIPPFFTKRWTGRRDRLRRGLQLAARWAGAGLDRVRLELPLIVPDCVDLDAPPGPDLGPGPVIVIKSVSSLGRVRLLHDAGASVVLILRHPCGYVASILRGIRTGRMRGDFFPEALSTTLPARRRGLTAAMLADLDQTARYATSWALFNDHALEALEGAERVVVVSYDALTRDPVAGARRLFAASGLSWSPQTEAFLATLRQADGGQGYFDVRRNSSGQYERWRQELSPEQIETVEACVAGSLAYGLHGELAATVLAPGDEFPAVVSAGASELHDLAKSPPIHD